MESLYSYANIIHLLLAIVFLGHLFTDLTLLSPLKKKLDPNARETMKKTLAPKSFQIFPLTFLFIILSGGIMMSQYINAEAGFFKTPLQQILLFKIFLASLIALGICYNVYTKFTHKPRARFMEEYFHTFALFLGVLIVISAKLMLSV